MTRYELNKAIMEASGWELKPNFSLNKKSKDRVYLLFSELSCGKSAPYTFDYNSWDDLMPLVVEHEILEQYCFFKESDGCHMHSGKGSKFHVIAESHKRALAECLLKHLTIK